MLAVQIFAHMQRIQNKFESGHNDTCTFYKGFMPDFLRLHLKIKKAANTTDDTTAAK